MTFSYWHALQDAKFREIADLIAVSLGYGSFDVLGAEEKLVVELETREAIARWEEIAEMMMPSVEPKNSLQKLLREHHNIGEMILNIRVKAGSSALISNMPFLPGDVPRMSDYAFIRN